MIFAHIKDLKEELTEEEFRKQATVYQDPLKNIFRRPTIKKGDRFYTFSNIRNLGGCAGVCIVRNGEVVWDEVHRIA